MRLTSPGSAPSAIRTPNSWVRCDTREGEHAVDADDGQQQGQHAEGPEHLAEERVLPEALAAQLLHRARREHRQRRVRGADRLADLRRQRRGGAAARTRMPVFGVC